MAAHRRDLASSPLAGRVPLWVGEGGASYGGFAHGGSWGDRKGHRIMIPLGSTTHDTFTLGNSSESMTVLLTLSHSLLTTLNASLANELTLLGSQSTAGYGCSAVGCRTWRTSAALRATAQPSSRGSSCPTSATS